MWSLPTLAKACAYGTFAGVGMVLFVYEHIQHRIRKSECYIEAFKHFHENKGAVKYFGAPLQAGYISNINQSEDQNDTVYWYKVPLRGPDGKGLLYYKTVKDPDWFLARVELELEKMPGKKFPIMEKDTSTKLDSVEGQEESTEEELIEENSTEGQTASEI